MFDHLLFDKTSFDNDFLLTDISISMYGNGTVEYLGIFENPIPSIELNGDGSLSVLSLLINTFVSIDLLENTGYPSVFLVMLTPLNIDILGIGEFEIFRIGNTGISLLDLNGIELYPGDSVIIDTDLMSVLFGQIQDVSSLTVASTFFDLGVGLNQLTFMATYETDPNPRTNTELDVDIIWQNRWL